MALPKKLQLGDVGTELVCRVIDPAGELVDLGDANELQVQLGRPDGTYFLRTAELVTDGSDALLRYTTQGGDIDAAGTWKLQAIVQFPSTPAKHRSEVLTFLVERNIDGDSLITPAGLGMLLDLPALTVA